MTPDEIILWCAIVAAVARLASPLLAGAFCIRPAAQRLRTLSEWSIGFVFLRIVAIRIDNLSASDWLSAAILIAAAAMSVAVLLHHLRRVVGPHGDRC